MKTTPRWINGLAAAAMCMALAPRAGAVELTDQQLAELLAMKSRIVALEHKVGSLAKEAETAKADAAAARAEAEAAKAQLAAAGGPGAPAAPHGATDLDALDVRYTGAGSLQAAAAGAWSGQTSIGGYGEHHINHGDVDQNDFHRWVLLINHQFDDRFRFVSELELEHAVAGEGQNGEIELEQAYIEMDLDSGNYAKAGVFLIPVGILNEVHEPTTFFGVERNPIEREIIPTTWWEGGAAYTKHGDNGAQFDLAVHSGLSVPTTGSNAFRIRSGRQKASEADGDSPAATARLRYTGIPGLEVAGTVQWQDDITQSQEGASQAWLGAGHVDFQKGNFGLRALAGHWSIDGEAPKALGLDEQWGGYIEPSITCDLPYGRGGVFARYNYFDAALGEMEQYDAGINYWPIEDIVFKLDYSRVNRLDGGEDEDIVSAGFGYLF